MPFKSLKIKEPIPNEEALAEYLFREDSLLVGYISMFCVSVQLLCVSFSVAESSLIDIHFWKTFFRSVKGNPLTVCQT